MTYETAAGRQKENIAEVTTKGGYSHSAHNYKHRNIKYVSGQLKSHCFVTTFLVL